MIKKYETEFLRKNILKKDFKVIYLIILLIFFMIKFYNIAWSLEKELYLSTSIQRDFLKIGNFKKHSDIVKVWIDSRLFPTEDLQIVVYPMLKYNISDEKLDFNFRKFYLALSWNDIYLSIGKQVIIWGVARGKNPTNYLMPLQLFDKQREPEFSLEGIESFMIEFPIQKFTVESVFTDFNYFENATRIRTFLWDTDLSFSFNINKKGIRIGCDFEKDFHELFGLYGEYAVKNFEDDYEFVIGISKVIPYFKRSTIDFEYQKSVLKNNNEDTLNIQLNISPSEEFSFLYLSSYDINKNILYLMSKFSYYLGKMELTLVTTFKFGNKDNFPFKYMISPKIIYYF